jgi:hypothetical protein
VEGSLDDIPSIQMILVPVGSSEIFRLSWARSVKRNFLLNMASAWILTPLGLGSRQKFQILFDCGQL